MIGNVSQKNLESNRLHDPRANFAQLWLLIIGGFIVGSWLVWVLILAINDQLFFENNYRTPDFIATGLTPWTTERGFVWADFVGIALYFVLVILFSYLLFGHKFKSKPETRIDGYAKAMGYGNSIKGLLESTCQKKATRLLKVEQGLTPPPGIRLGNLVINDQTVYSDWEAEILVVAGPRTGKSVGFVIPSIIYAPGPVIATSNKRDIVDATLSLRKTNGKIWLFDPESIASGSPQWYWNPINSVRHLEDAKRIADCWRSAAGLNDSSGNSEFFNGKAAEQLSSFLFAASLENLTMDDVFFWCQNDKNDQAARILKSHGYINLANSVYALIGITPETRSGVYGGLQKMVSFLVDDKLRPWIQKINEQDDRPEFDPLNFPLSKDTLYLLSQKGAMSTPITSALTAITARAGYEISQGMGGRLPLPLVGVLDECANVCPWPELPEIYSYYGSCGIILMSLFQNTAQGIMAFGNEGFKSLFDNANTFVYLGGNKDDKFLPQLSTLIGQRDVLSHSVNDNQGFTNSETRSLRQEKILSEQQLQEWPEFRGLVLSSQNRTTIVKTVPWFNDVKIKDKIEQSLTETKKQINQEWNIDTLRKGQTQVNVAESNNEPNPQVTNKVSYIDKILERHSK